MANFDLSSLDEGNNTQLLVKKPSKKNNETKKDKKIVTKLGRPMESDEPRNRKVSLNLSESEITELERMAGDVPLAKFLRKTILSNLLH